MAIRNEEPFNDSDDGEGVYSDKDILYDIRLRFCQYMHGESLTEIFVCRDSHNLKRLYIIAAEFVQSLVNAPSLVVVAPAAKTKVPQAEATGNEQN
ncbi:unnamed protein product [Amaranthus hypochondriacus]